MATKKTSKKKSKKTAAIKRAAPRKYLAKKKVAPKRKVLGKKRSGKNKKVRGKSERVDTVVFEPKGIGAGSAGQSGDLQGLSGTEGADSESVGELLEEGNAFEAEVVKGVEDAQDADEGEVRTHQRPQEEDLPEDFREN